jgi:SAM-dependent methyltransferase
MGERPEWVKKEDRDWEKVYSKWTLAQIPWHSDKPDKEFVELIEGGTIPLGSVLDVGCGAGTDAIYLASKGCDVTAIDISHEAIRIAREGAEKAGARVSFIVSDFLDTKFHNGSFDFVNDRGCFHHMNPLRREDFAAEVNRVLTDHGFYYLRCWSDKQEGEGGPYKISKDIINRIFSKCFDVGEIRDFRFGGAGARGYMCLMKRRTSADCI